MIYWLFTNGRETLSGLLIPLLCLTPILLPMTATMMGAGIRRTSDERAKSSALRRGMLIVTYAVILLTITTFYLTVLGDQAVQRGRSNASGVIELLVGAPRGINTMRLFLFGVMLAFILMVTAIGLHSLLRNGGWLREKIDRLRAPIVKRGALGSSHFCTLREYRRFRRPDPDGLILLGAFWGEKQAAARCGNRAVLSGWRRRGARHPDARRSGIGQDAGHHPARNCRPDALRAFARRG